MIYQVHDISCLFYSLGVVYGMDITTQDLQTIAKLVHIVFHFFQYRPILVQPIPCLTLRSSRWKNLAQCISVTYKAT